MSKPMNREKPKRKRIKVKYATLAYTTTPTGQLCADGEVYDQPEGRKRIHVK